MHDGACKADSQLHSVHVLPFSLSTRSVLNLPGVAQLQIPVRGFSTRFKMQVEERGDVGL